MSATLNRLLKQAAKVHEGGGRVSRFLANTVGLPSRAQTAMILGNRNLMEDPAWDPERTDKHREVVDRLTNATPDQLSKTIVRLGGMDALDDLVWARKGIDGEDRPWYRRIGGRLAQSDAGPLTKLRHGISYPLNYLSSTLGAADHYNPATDVATVFSNNPAITSHELGHAIDFNDDPNIRQKWTGVMPALKNIASRAKRDAYEMSYGLPGFRSYIESQANRRSHDAIEKGYEDAPEKKQELLDQREALLPGAYGSYIGGDIAAGADLVAPGAGRALGALPLVGIGAGRLYSGAKSMLRGSKPPAAPAPAPAAPASAPELKFATTLGLLYKAAAGPVDPVEAYFANSNRMPSQWMDGPQGPPPVAPAPTPAPAARPGLDALTGNLPEFKAPQLDYARPSNREILPSMGGASGGEVVDSPFLGSQLFQGMAGNQPAPQPKPMIGPQPRQLPAGPEPFMGSMQLGRGPTPSATAQAPQQPRPASPANPVRPVPGQQSLFPGFGGGGSTLSGLFNRASS